MDARLQKMHMRVRKSPLDVKLISASHVTNSPAENLTPLVQSKRERLAAEYRAAVTAYAEAVAAMDGLRDAEFEQARFRAKQARLHCDECRIALEACQEDSLSKTAEQR